MVQLGLFNTGDTALLEEVDRRLGDHFDHPSKRRVLLDPVSQLVFSMLGARTLGTVSLQTFEGLRYRYRRWEDLRDAPEDEIGAAIKQVTFPEAKAAYLKASLQKITDLQGRLALDFLEAYTVPEALSWLETLPGVGRKISAAILNFSTLCKKAMVIDTHHQRIMQRLGLAARTAGISDVYDRVMPCVPETWSADRVEKHHWLVKRLGQTLCRRRDRFCPQCPLEDLCPTARAGPLPRRR